MNPMRVLVIGGGGREHAIVWRLGRSASVEKVWCAPGNGGISRHAECEALDLADVTAAAELAVRLKADLTVVGPELPLALGISDAFAKRGLALVGPATAAAQLEGSKIFAKQFAERHQIPTARAYGVCESAEQARNLLESIRVPLVIKADGLCAGKGVEIAQSREQAEDFVSRSLKRHEFGRAGERLLFEEALSGEELSYIILTDGERLLPMAPARDHKRAYDGDLGPNTGGMGAYSTDELLPLNLERTILDSIVEPTLRGLREDGIRYRGFLYFGLMLTAEGPKLLEYNCRLGDPETEAVLLRADFDFAEACLRAAKGSLDGFQARWLPGASACLVIASEGYPSHPITGREILGLEAQDSDSVVFHAGTKREGNSFVTNAGRVLVVAAQGRDLEQALGRVYARTGMIHIDGSFHRKDIGASARPGRTVAPA